ncbi:MAG: glycosyltransferase [Candidatus Omnitrophica bacterium]|nr:glycosyltransferase [Candidatus Omnitrophota bacterium]
MKKLRILIQTDTYAMGGAEKYLMEVLPYLTDHGYEVNLICRDFKVISELRNFFIGLNCPVLSLPKNFLSLTPVHIKKALKLLLSSDVVFINKIYPTKSLLFIISGVLLRKKVVCFEHLPGPVASNNWLRSVILRFLIRLVMFNVECVLCSTVQCKEFCISYYHYPSEKIKVIEHGIDLSRIGDLSIRNNNKLVRIALVGRLCEQKGQLSFIEMVDQLVNKVNEQNFEVEFWGDGELESRIKAQVLEKGLSRYIHLKGRSLNKNEIFEDKDFIVIPSVWEAQCYVLLEAASFKIPAIAFDVGGIKNFITNGVNGVLISPYDKLEFVKAVHSFIRDRDLCKSMGILAYDKVVKDFSKEKMVNKLLTVFKEYE